MEADNFEEMQSSGAIEALVDILKAGASTGNTDLAADALLVLARVRRCWIRLLDPERA